MSLTTTLCHRASPFPEGRRDWRDQVRREVACGHEWVSLRGVPRPPMCFTLLFGGDCRWSSGRKGRPGGVGHSPSRSVAQHWSSPTLGGRPPSSQAKRQVKSGEKEPTKSTRRIKHVKDTTQERRGGGGTTPRVSVDGGLRSRTRVTGLRDSGPAGEECGGPEETRNGTPQTGATGTVTENHRRGRRSWNGTTVISRGVPWRGPSEGEDVANCPSGC